MGHGRYPGIVGQDSPRCPRCPAAIGPTLLPVESEGGTLIALNCPTCGSSFRPSDGQVIRLGRN